MNTTALDFNNGLRIFILALIDDQMVSSDEGKVSERLNSIGSRIPPKDLRTIMDFAKNCGYLEPVGSQLAFTRKAIGRGAELRERNIKSNKLTVPDAQSDSVNLVGL